MGQVVQNQADIAILTSDDTRNEKIKDINQQIISGFDLSNAQENKPNSFPKEKIFNYYQIENRQDAFNQAIKIAQPGDTIIACGKGHETSILLGNTEYPWSESEAFRTAFRLRKST
jgi:UDP-N-acetylmuramoyl-L-alanyl-D-glutamate--2,6-diaminopimelate ligase